jgi:CRP-like cAMP-binding protein/MFS family permease
LAIAAEWAHFVALGVFAYHHGGTAFVGLSGLARLLPAGALAPFAASLGDRFPRDRLLLFLLVLEAGALAGSGVAAATGGRMTVLLLAAVIGMTSTVVRPMVQSILPSLARTSAELVASNGATSTFEGLGVLLGPLIAGAAILIVGPAGVFIGAGVALIIAAVILLRVAVPVQVYGAAPNGRSRPTASSGSTRTGLAADPARTALAGFGLVAGDPQLRLLVGLSAAQCFVRGCLNVLVVVAAFGALHAGSPGVGYLNAGLGVGALIGAFGATTLSTKRLAVSFGVALTLWGAPISLVGVLTWLAPAILCLVVIGGANSVEDVAVITLMQRGAADEMLSSVLGVFWGMAMMAVAVGSIVAPAIVRAAGDRSALLLLGLILPVLALLSGRRLVHIDANFQPSDALGLVDAIPMFAPLSLAIKERLAASLSPVLVTAGTTVIHTGDPGDRLYIVRNGQLAIEQHGVQIARATDGDCIGEIALLHDVPRIASVRAEVDSNLYWLGRDAFLAAITGSAAALARGAPRRGRAPRCGARRRLTQHSFDTTRQDEEHQHLLIKDTASSAVGLARRLEPAGGDLFGGHRSAPVLTGDGRDHIEGCPDQRVGVVTAPRDA